MRALFGGIVSLTILSAAPPAMASECFQFANAPAPKLYRAAFELGAEDVGIRYVGHSSYLIVSPEGHSIATDWSGDFEYRLDKTPDVVTMNHAHETHWTAYPDPEIDHVLEGWGEEGKPREHFLRVGETLIRNVPTDIRGGYAGIEPFGNSIFIFEVAGLCIGHLGHLHHMPTEEQFAALGRLDVVMAPVDGTFTLDTAQMLEVLKRLRAQVVLPMHAFGRYTLEAFLEGMEEEFAIERLDGNALVLNWRDLPKRPTVFVPKGV